MTVTTPEETWTAPRLDELSERVKAGFEKADADVREVRGDMKAGFEKADEKMEDGFAKVDATFGEVRSEMKAGFERFDEKFDKLMWRMLAAALSIIVLMIKAHGL
jgi:hypothetical protein